MDWYVCVCVFINIYPYVLRFYWPIPRSHFRPAYVQVSRLYTFQPFRQSNWTKYVVLNPKKVSYLFWLTFRQLISAKVNWIEQQNWPTCATENGDIIYNASLTQLYFVCLLFNQIVHGRRHIPNFFSTCRPFPLFSIYIPGQRLHFRLPIIALKNADDEWRESDLFTFFFCTVWRHPSCHSRTSFSLLDPNLCLPDCSLSARACSPWLTTEQYPHINC